MPVTLVWEKFPSVTTGGKPFFWVGRRITPRCTRKIAVVCWDRLHEKWYAEDGDEKRLGLFFTVGLAKARVEDLFPGEWTERDFFEVKTSIIQRKRRA
jgi:hypothetical protein